MTPTRATVTGATITAVATIIVAIITNVSGLWHLGSSDPNLRFPVAVFDSTTKEGISGAAVSLNLPDISPDFTDSRGQHTFQLTPSTIGKQTQLTVSKDGYEAFNQQLFHLDRRDSFVAIYLKIAHPAPPPAVEPSALTRDYSSGPKLSGAGANFSSPYELCSGGEPGYKIQSAEFMLSGDRNCNQWSRCVQTTNTESRVCWQFSLQGHNEWPPPGQGQSEGHLIVHWTRSN